jgi:hypothetical protein
MFNRKDKADSFLRLCQRSDFSDTIFKILSAGEKISKISVNIEQSGTIVSASFYTRDLTLRRVEELIAFANSFPLNFNEFVNRAMLGR